MHKQSQKFRCCNVILIPLIHSNKEKLAVINVMPCPGVSDKMVNNWCNNYNAFEQLYRVPKRTKILPINIDILLSEYSVFRDPSKGFCP